MRPEGERRVSEVLEESTTVTAPIIASVMPKRSRCVSGYDCVKWRSQLTLVTTEGDV